MFLVECPCGNHVNVFNGRGKLIGQISFEAYPIAVLILAKTKTMADKIADEINRRLDDVGNPHPAQYQGERMRKANRYTFNWPSRKSYFERN